MKFNSQICTTREQSERLISLGLKKETADMFIGINWGNEIAYDNNGGYTGNLDTTIPAWSLHKLLSMLPDDAPKIFWILDGASITIEFEDVGSDFFPHKGDIYEGVVNCIEWLIKEGYFPKEYLE